jgi:hypothetical protein
MKNELERRCAVGEMMDGVGNAGPPDIALDQSSVAVIVLDHNDVDRLMGVHAG